MIKIIVQLLFSFSGGQLKIVADNQNIHVGGPFDNQHLDLISSPADKKTLHASLPLEGHLGERGEHTLRLPSLLMKQTPPPQPFFQVTLVSSSHGAFFQKCAVPIKLILLPPEAFFLYYPDPFTLTSFC